MKNQFFRINPICEYGRSPIRVEAIEEYELFENFLSYFVDMILHNLMSNHMLSLIFILFL